MPAGHHIPTCERELILGMLLLDGKSPDNIHDEYISRLHPDFQITLIHLKSICLMFSDPDQERVAHSYSW